MKIQFECDDPEVCKLILKALLEHIESKDMCKQLELSIEMAKKIRKHADFCGRCGTCGHLEHTGICKALDAAGDECDCE